MLNKFVMRFLKEVITGKCKDRHSKLFDTSSDMDKKRETSNVKPPSSKVNTRIIADVE